MKLKELTKQLFGDNIQDKMIGIYEGEDKKIYPDFADEMLETHGDHNVVDYQYVESKKVLVVELENADNGERR